MKIELSLGAVHVGGGAAALDGSDLALELEGAFDVVQNDGTRSGARDLDGAVVEDAAPQVLLDEYALDLADDNLVGMTVQPAVAMEKSLITHKDGCGQVLNEAAQVQVGPAGEARLVDDGLSRSNNSAYFHN